MDLVMNEANVATDDGAQTKTTTRPWTQKFPEFFGTHNPIIYPRVLVGTIHSKWLTFNDIWMGYSILYLSDDHHEPLWFVSDFF